VILAPSRRHQPDPTPPDCRRSRALGSESLARRFVLTRRERENKGIARVNTLLRLAQLWYLWKAPVRYPTPRTPREPDSKRHRPIIKRTATA
jgi:hypothetical protein